MRARQVKSALGSRGKDGGAKGNVKELEEEEEWTSSEEKNPGYVVQNGA
jgi:hypothetical protein